ncbi:unnamed protein product [Ilex paraguariensis]|uniref:BLISTER n=1 Tax=Ilex paraguariensis TaxID=185542 RepID=A0ABC8UT61_9AQUA
MASAQVLPNSRKQEHLEAGKRRLEEFRKKKAAEKAKKAAPSSQLHTTDLGVLEKQPSEAERVRLADSDGAGTSDVVGIAGIESSGVTINNEVRSTEFVQKDELGSSHEKDASPLIYANNHYIYFADPTQTHAKDKDFRHYDVSGSSGPINYADQDKERNYDLGIYSRTSGGLADGIATAKGASLHPPSVQDGDSNSSQYGYYGLDESLPSNGHSHLKDYKVSNLVTNVSPEGSGINLLQNMPGYPEPPANRHTSSSEVHFTSGVTDPNPEVERSVPDALESSDSRIPDTGEWKHSSSVGHLISANSPLMPSESRSTGFSFDVGGSSNHVSASPALAATNTRRSRPSFLDSINVARVSSESTPPSELEKADSFSSKVYPMDILASPASQNSMNSSVLSGIGGDRFRHGVTENMERKHEFYPRKQDDDFAALEQHIEDLTQEKFSLQRALEASRALAESLAAENSALTNSYNQQGTVVNQLRSDMENLQEEIKAHLVELESMKIEYANAQLECNAADERAKLLASEVIGLEEKMTVMGGKREGSDNRIGGVAAAGMGCGRDLVAAIHGEKEGGKNKVGCFCRFQLMGSTDKQEIFGSGILLNNPISRSGSWSHDTSIWAKGDFLKSLALRLRSSELKLERQLENSQAEMSSFRKKISNLEKDRQDLQSTLNALQEEKKLLQSKLRKASASGKLVDVSKSLTSTKEVSTSTEDLEKKLLQSKLRKASASGKLVDVSKSLTSTKEVSTSTEDLGIVDLHNSVRDTSRPDILHYSERNIFVPVSRNDTDASTDTPNSEMPTTAHPFEPENGQFSLESLSSNIPADQMRMIQNINTLISEFALEKEEWMRALSTESSQSTILKEKNKELSRKLEVQTQRLELLTAQSMAHNIIPERQPDARTMNENTPYADEGDEVVERMLGWIMKLFPGGPSRRRTSKLL